MKSEQAEVFLSKMKEKIYNGEFDKDLNLPFMSRKLFYTSIKNKVNKKLETKSTPLLSELEIKQVLKDVKETAVFTTAIFLETGILSKDEEGKYVVHSKIRKPS